MPSGNHECTAFAKASVTSMPSSTDIIPVRFWHASFDDLPIGTVLAPRAGYDDRWRAMDAGRIIEAHRPESQLAHRNAVFMCDDAQDCDNCGAHCVWLFEVVPDGPMTRHDLAWATRIDDLISRGRRVDDRAILTATERYWTGIPSDNPVWEYLATSATIIGVERY